MSCTWWLFSPRQLAVARGLPLAAASRPGHEPRGHTAGWRVADAPAGSAEWSRNSCFCATLLCWCEKVHRVIPTQMSMSQEIGQNNADSQMVESPSLSLPSLPLPPLSFSFSPLLLSVPVFFSVPLRKFRKWLNGVLRQNKARVFP